MKKLALFGLLWCGVALAGPGSDASGSAGSAGSAAVAPTQPAPAPSTEAPAPGSPQHILQQQCIELLNTDASFMRRVQAGVNTQNAKDLDKEIVAAHQDADYHIQKNERHVIYAYAAMWIVAALFVVFLWLRQASLKAEIASLRRDLDAAAKEAK